MKKLFPIALALLLFAVASSAQPARLTPTPAGGDHHDQVPTDPFRLKPLEGSVYALYGRGGNVGFFVGPEAVLVIDSQFKDLAPGIIAQIRKVSDKPIKFLLNTHHHGGPRRRQ
jgi:glyoxylase-like metal-dependent hydrolase (beta-lactamase superfamily II)